MSKKHTFSRLPISQFRTFMGLDIPIDANRDSYLPANIETHAILKTILLNFGLDKPVADFDSAIDKDGYTIEVISNENGSFFIRARYPKDDHFAGVQLSGTLQIVEMPTQGQYQFALETLSFFMYLEEAIPNGDIIPLHAQAQYMIGTNGMPQYYEANNQNGVLAVLNGLRHEFLACLKGEQINDAHRTLWLYETEILSAQEFYAESLEEKTEAQMLAGFDARKALLDSILSAAARAKKPSLSAPTAPYLH